MLTDLHFFLEVLRKIVFLRFSSAIGLLDSLVHDLLSSSKPALTAWVFLTSHCPDPDSASFLYNIYDWCDNIGLSHLRYSLSWSQPISNLNPYTNLITSLPRNITFQRLDVHVDISGRPLFYLPHQVMKRWLLMCQWKLRSSYFFCRNIVKEFLKNSDFTQRTD